MMCAWNEFLSVVPIPIRQEVDKLGREHLQELRLRLGQPVELVMHKDCRRLSHHTTEEDIRYVVNTASRFSPWSATSTAKGYITATGGHRIGLSGDCVIQNGVITGFRRITSLCMRVARSYNGIAKGIPDCGSILIIGPPGSGKTTLLRELIRIRSDYGAITVVDERGELFPIESIFERGISTDVLTGCNKAQGLEIALRTMGPQSIAVDEVTASEDCDALMAAARCGVDLLATAHAASLTDIYKRRIYRPIWESGIFTHAVILNRQKTWHLERMTVCT